MLSKPKIYLLQLGDPPKDILHAVGDMPNWFDNALHEYTDLIEVIKVSMGQPLPEINSRNIAILTGSWSMVTEKKLWSEQTAVWIRAAVTEKMPLFGICYGHQLISYALGGIVEFHPNGIEIGCKKIYRTDQSLNDPLLEQVTGDFYAYLSHKQTVKNIPKDSQVLAFSEHDRHQVIRYNKTTVSVQFHPEFTPAIANAFIQSKSEQLKQEGVDIKKIRQEVMTKNSIAVSVLQNFISQNLDDVKMC